MNPDHLNIEIRKFLKAVGVTSQREIEAAVPVLDKRGASSSNPSGCFEQMGTR